MGLTVNRQMAKQSTVNRQKRNIREVKHDVNGKRQTAKITSDFEFFSCNP